MASFVSIMSDSFGNHYDKYASRNPVERRLMRGFFRHLIDLCKKGPHAHLLEAGCGEGHLANRLIGPLRPQSYHACDLRPESQIKLYHPIHYQYASIYELPFPDAHFDLVLACEVLEHLEDPRLAISELTRVAKHAVIVSTPREPLWRTLNVVRGAYLQDAGNTPGHVQHFSRHDLWDLCNPYLEELEDRCPIPWTILRGRPRR